MPSTSNQILLGFLFLEKKMARIRSLKPDFFKDEDLACLPFEARLLFQGLWCLADREGRLEDRPRYIKAEIFPYDKVDIEKLLNHLSSPMIPHRPNKVFLRRYSVGDRQYIEIVEFLKHQLPHHTERKSVIPCFNGSLTVKEPLSNGKSQEGAVICNLLSVNGNRNNVRTETALLDDKTNLTETTKTTDVISEKNTETYNQIITHLNTVLKTNYKHTSKKTKDLIKARLADGFTFDNFKTVIERKAAQWQSDEKMHKYLRPETLFGNKFESYLNESPLLDENSCCMCRRSLARGEITNLKNTEKGILCDDCSASGKNAV